MKYTITINMILEIDAETAQQAYKISQNLDIPQVIDWDTKRIWDDRGNQCEYDIEDNQL